MTKQTKIVCTMGPSSEDKDTIIKMVQAGMNVCRLNFSHGDYASHQKLIDTIRTVSAELNEPLAIMADLQGPRIRTGDLPAKGVPLADSDDIILTTASDKYHAGRIPVTYTDLHQELNANDRIYIDDALITLQVDKIENTNIHCRVLQGGILRARRGMNFPDSVLSIKPITDKDIEDLKFALKNNVDWIALSFVSSAKDVYDLRYIIKELTGGKPEDERTPVLTLAKIERKTAMENIEEIIEAADGIMVARGDLGIEVPPEDVPLHQKKIINLCLAAAKPVIVATQMLDSMVRNPRPTRAEVSDVANAVIDHADAVMLSAESATGKYPVPAVETMNKIIIKTEASEYDDLVFQGMLKTLPTDTAVSQVANILAASVKAKLILVASLSGYTARIVCRYRPQLPIFATTDSDRVRRQLNMSWGVTPFLLPTCKSIEELVDRSMGYLKKEKKVAAEDRIIIIAGEPVGQPGVNLVEIKEVR
ncbi:MAG: pyruvate kinase [bacterium]|nr:pyruvate kinase [bacterium]